MAKTFAVAKHDVLNALKDAGWAVNSNLKIPHATSPSGKVRLWFKAQAIHFTTADYGQRHEFGNARSIYYDLDIRTVDPKIFAEKIERVILDR